MLAVGLAVGVYLVRRFKGIDILSFLVASREVGVLLGMVTIGISWASAPAFLISSQQAYINGIPGLAWFILPNAGSLLIVAYLGNRMKKVFGTGYTLAQFMGRRVHSSVEGFYCAETIIHQTYGLLLTLTGSTLILQAVTELPRNILVLFMGVTILSWSMLRGFRSALVADVIKFFWVLVGFVLVWLTISHNGGLATLANGLGGVSGQKTNIFDLGVFLSFGFAWTMSLIPAAPADEVQWQRVFSLRRDLWKSYLGGFAIFSLLVFVFGLLGFEAAALHPEVKDPQLAGFTVMTQTFPWVTGMFGFLILFALLASGSGQLNAFSSVWSVNVYGLWRRWMQAPKSSGADLLRVSRKSMLGIMVLALVIVLFFEIPLVKLVFFIGVVRSAYLVPTWLALKEDFRLNTWLTNLGISLAVITGVVLFAYSQMTGDTTILVIGTAMPLLITLLVCWLGSCVFPGKAVNWKEVHP